MQTVEEELGEEVPLVASKKGASTETFFPAGRRRKERKGRCGHHGIYVLVLLRPMVTICTGTAEILSPLFLLGFKLTVYAHG